MMIPFSKYFLPSLLCLGLSASFLSCTDDLTNNGAFLPQEENIDLENSLVVPFTISLGGIDAYTRDADEASIEDPGYQNGSSREHQIDFGLDPETQMVESFAIFFDDQADANGYYPFKYIKRLYTHSSLGSPFVPDDGIGEYSIYCLAYLDTPEGFNDDTKSEEEKLAMLPGKVLVVLNGSRIYPQFLEQFKIQEDGTSTEALTSNDFLLFKWKSQYSLDASGGDDGVIGINNEGHFTMTNSAYYGPKEVVVEVQEEDGSSHWEVQEETGVSPEQYELRTINTLNKHNILPAFASNIEQKNSAAKIYVERMVAKFSTPVFNTEVIGSNKVFRPSEGAQSLVIYDWVNGALHATETSWRIHVLGWTINGRETENYLFKHISNARRDGLDGWNFSEWNDYGRRRSYWSIDPHYDNTENEVTHKTPFYPWQYRGAVDKKGISYARFNSDNEEIALRYLPFEDVNYWSENAVTISENTFKPGVQYDRSVTLGENEKWMDGRTNSLVGPHLLVTAQVYLENQDNKFNDYIGQFSTVDNLYGDRYYRYYTKEFDWFRMFVRELNDALATQSSMTFPYYFWNADGSGNDSPPSYIARPTGKCALLLDLNLDNHLTPETPQYSDEQVYEFTESLSEQELATYRFLQKNKEKYHLKEVSKVLDELEKDLNAGNIKISIDAIVKDGDGRVLPWIPGLVFRNKENPGDILEIYNGSIADENKVGFWTNDMRKSLIASWFGVIDHFFNGYMYYSAPIPHRLPQIDGNTEYYGSVRNHWYTFTVTAINSLGTPVSDITQPIIPAKYNYQDQISVYLRTRIWHTITTVGVEL